MTPKKPKCLKDEYQCQRERHGASKEGYCIFHAKAEDKKVTEFRRALQGYINEIETKNLDYNFVGFIFVSGIGVTVFKNANFFEAQFLVEPETEFLNVKFQGETNFSNAKFRGDAKFPGTEFEGDVYFGGAEFQQGVQFGETKFKGKAYISPKFINTYILFHYTTLENISLTPLNLCEKASIDFTAAKLRNTDIRRKDIEDHILQERMKWFSKAKEIYLLLKNNFHSLGRYDDESWAFRKEKEMERKSYFHFNVGSFFKCLWPMLLSLLYKYEERKKWKYYFKPRLLAKWLWSMFLNILCGYGERPERSLLIGTGAVFFFAFLFKVIGISDLAKQSSGNIWDCLYFSVVTFTTLGYGDVRPLVGIGRIIAGIEAFTGVILIALFIFTFARRTGGR